jgi:hypothetical protein
MSPGPSQKYRRTGRVRVRIVALVVAAALVLIGSSATPVLAAAAGNPARVSSPV